MFWQKGGGEMETPAQSQDAAVEELKGLQMEKLTGKTLPQYEGFIEAMKYNALDKNKNRALKAARHTVVDRLPHTYLREGQKGGLFVMKDGERVVGFVALRLHPEEDTGHIERIWHSDPHHQANTLARMLMTSEKYFRDHQCGKGVIEAPEMSRDLTRVTNRYKVENFYSIISDEDEESEIVGERRGK